jgi:hypothetical protein
MVDTTITQKPAYEIFRDIMVSLVGFDLSTDEQMIREIYNVSDVYFAERISAEAIPTLLAGSPNAPKSYQDYLGKYQAIKAMDTGITTVADFVGARNEYKQLLRLYGLSDIANNDSADKFLMNGVSADEAGARMQVAYNAVVYADAELKKQLKTFYPSLTDTDIVANILGVGKTVAELQQQINVAGIRAEEATAGLQSTIGAEELAKQGLTRAEARKGFQNVAESLAGAQAAATRAGQDATTIQTELEKEQLLGLRSKRRAQLAAREQGLLAGQSGAGQTALQKNSIGKF